MSSLDYLDLCRLCLVKDRVSVPIFEGEGDVRQIFLKITACLPVKVAREDKLPKKICDDCVYKVELIYQFWHTTANAEKQLLQWLGEVNMEDKQSYVGTVLNPNGMKPEQSSENRLDGTVMQQVGEHQNNMTMGMMDNMGLTMPMMMSSNTQQQITSVPIDNSGSSVQNVQPVAGPSTQTSHDQITQDQTNASTQQEEEEESSEEEENSDDECDGDEGLPIKEESEEDPNNRTLEPTTFVNVSLACDEAGPSGLQQQKIADMPEMVMSQTSDVDPKTGDSSMDPLNIMDINNSEYSLVESIECTPEYDSLPNRLKRHIIRKRKMPKEENHCTKKDSKKQKHDQNKIDKRKPELFLECATCGKRFSGKPIMIKHMKQHKYQCQTCCQSFSLKRDMKRHIEKVHGPLLYPCSICEYKSNNKCTLKDHFIRKHTNSFQYTCKDCKKQFKIKNDLKQHMNQVHSGAPPIICSICGHACKNVPAIKAHMKYRHYKPAYECKICKRGLTTQENLEQHLIWHERKEKVICPTCGKTFGQKRDLDLHLRIHQGIRPFSCPVCSKTFPRKTAQEQHILIHTGKRPYICDICGQTFAQKPGLICHRKRHPGPLPPLPVVSIKKIIMDFTQELGVPLTQQQDKITLDS
ncbi:zinc finger protein 2-like isoform X15 [Cataglyphis hispanica]|uniref:zinc finger protein 2-like isoform X15 n=1 Tax=Cataglyphis hispanica TaxID=1086592 RepID=UPI00217FBB44|nr:zinc finger protein 2-like isoform X15 [Cataglyphis hispanica]